MVVLAMPGDGLTPKPPDLSPALDPALPGPSLVATRLVVGTTGTSLPAPTRRE
jgi:hypothetical protein